MKQRGNRIVSANGFTIADMLIFHELMNLHLIDGFTLNGKGLKNLETFIHEFAKQPALKQSLTKLKEAFADSGVDMSFVL